MIVPPLHPRPAPSEFSVVDLNARGEVLLEADYTYDALERLPHAADLIVTFATSIWRTPDEFELDVANGQAAEIRVRWWGCARGAGMFTVRHAGEVASLSLLASGLDAAGDTQTLQVFQQHLLRELHDTGTEPAFGLLELRKRPLVATILLLPPAVEAARLNVALADRCFAAAFFRYHSLL